MYLGKSGKAKVEETPKGWYIQYIERDPEVLAQQEKLAKKKEMDLNDEERAKIELDKRMKLAKGAAPASSVPTKATELKRDQDFKISFSFGPKKDQSTTASSTSTETSNTEPITPEEDEIETVDYIPGEGEDILGQEKAQLGQIEDDSSSSELPLESPASPVSVPTKTVVEAPVEQPIVQSKQEDTITTAPIVSTDKDTKKRQLDSEAKAPASKITINPTKKKKLSAVELIAMEEEKKKESRNRKDYWLTEEIIVKVLNKELGDGKYYKEKGNLEIVALSH
jgi:DNA/RNA-binding protein KIN17